jgi:transposase
MSSLRFTLEFKDAAVLQITKRGYSVVEVSARIGVSVHSLYQWVSAVKPDKTDQQANDQTITKSEILMISKETFKQLGANSRTWL